MAVVVEKKKKKNNKKRKKKTRWRRKTAVAGNGGEFATESERTRGEEEALSFGGRRSLRTISSHNALFCPRKRGREKEKEIQIQRRRGSRTKRTRETDSFIMLYVEVVVSRDRGSRR